MVVSSKVLSNAEMPAIGRRFCSWSGSALEAADGLEVMRERRHATGGLLPVVVLVGSVVAVAGQAQAQEVDLAAQDVLHGLHGADAAALAGEGAGGVERELVGVPDGLGVGAGDVALEGCQAVLLVDLDIREVLVHEGADAGHGPLLVHVRHQAAAELDLGPWG